MEVDELVEPSFGVDNFRKPLIEYGTDALVKIILVVLFGKPGFYPNTPELGLYIQQYRKSKFEDLDLENLKAQLGYQCKILSSAIRDDMIAIQKAYLDAEKLEPVILITIQVEKGNQRQEVLLGIKSDGNNVTYNYMLYDPKK